MAMIKKKQEILELTRETLESSSIHAIPNITRNKFNEVKSIWIVCFIVSSGWCAFFMMRSLNDFFSYDVTSLYEINYVNKIEFPIVTICSLDSINSESLNLNISYQFETDYPQLEYKTLTHVKLNDLYTTNKIERATVNQTVISCKFGNKLCNLTQDFEYFYDFSYGQCFKFNSVGSNERKYVYQNGLSNGLIVELYVGSADQNNNMFSISQGMNIFLNNKSHFNSAYLEGINVSPGTTTKISIEKISLKKEQKPYSECTANLNSADSYPSETYAKSFSPNRTYSYTDCSFVCFQKKINEDCKCKVASLLGYNNDLRDCFSDTIDFSSVLNDFTCINNSVSSFFFSSDYVQKCNCPIECEKTYFKWSSSIAEFPTLKYYHYLKNSTLIRTKYPNITYQELKKSVARVEIFYDELNETQIVQKVKTK